MRNPLCFTIAGAALLLAAQGAARAEVKTAYLENAQEKAAHEVVAAYSALVMKDPQKAVDLYLSPDYVEHDHLAAMRLGLKHVGREDLVKFMKIDLGAGAAPGAAPGAGPGGGPPAGPPGGGSQAAGQIRVNDEMVTAIGPEGIDIFRVVNGKITDHWDASPMERITLPGENNMGPRNPPASNPAAPAN